MRCSWIGLVGAWIVVLLACASPAVALGTVGSKVQLSSTGAPGDLSSGASDPQLAWSGVSHEALAVWEDFAPFGAASDVVVGRLLDAAGRPRGPEFVVGGLTTAAPSGISVGAVGGGGFLVAAVVDTTGLSTQVLDVAISSRGTVGPARAVSGIAAFPASVGTPSLACDPQTGRAIVSWPLDSTDVGGRARDEGGIYARPVGRAGRPTGAAERLYREPAAASGVLDAVSIAYQPATGRWLAAWSQLVSYDAPPVHAAQDLFARSLLATGKPSGPIRELASPPEFRDVVVGAPQLATPPAGGDWLVSFAFDNALVPRSVRVIRVAPDGRVAGRRPVQVSVAPADPGAGSAAGVAIFAPALDRYLLVYSQSCNQTKGTSCPVYDPVLGQLLGSDGRRSGRPVSLAPAAIGGDTLVRTGRRSFLLAWPGAEASGAPYADINSGTTIYPQKSEIYARAVTV